MVQSGLAECDLFSFLDAQLQSEKAREIDTSKRRLSDESLCLDETEEDSVRQPAPRHPCPKTLLYFPFKESCRRAIDENTHYFVGSLLSNCEAICLNI